ncbi:hypothetical protein [Corallococcus sicarius]|uniref:hypothetical protein n=1 Tax=Corallococcus sicarius TaxID=2316726 RepID=UPI0011C35090|nr:hypothetical protein [Corallococcus sicarius]
MKIPEALAWFTEIDSRNVRMESGGMTEPSPNHSDAVRWITDAETAMKSVFPPGHAIVKRWEAVFSAAHNSNPAAWSNRYTYISLRAIFGAAKSQLESGRMSGLVESIRAETIEELLEQADTLVASNINAAAMVIAGGALESFLKHLCEKNSITWTGHGSLSAYERALGQARNNGNEVISASDGKLITGWGGLRNTAAHEPIKFTLGSTEVGLVIMHIREFIARHS